MNERIEFNRKSEEILDFVDIYGVMRCCQLDKFFPANRKNIDYLIKSKRLYVSSDGIYVGSIEDIRHGIRPDKAMIAALRVLADVIEKVKAHSRAAPPVQISFLTHSGDYYEIIYVTYGMEAMIAAAFGIMQSASQQRAGHADTTKRIIIVEDERQMRRLRMPGVVRFALVGPDERLTYYRVE